MTQAWRSLVLGLLLFGAALEVAAQAAPPPPPVAPPSPAPAMPPGREAPAPPAWSPPADVPKVDVSPLKAGLDQIEARFLHPIPRAELEARALAALLRELDPYSRYLDPGDLSLFADDLRAGFGGIGIRMDVDAATRLPRITYLVRGGAAELGGLRRGDLLERAGGVALAGADFGVVSSALRGAVGSTVALEILRPGVAAPLRVVLPRAQVATPSVLPLRRHADGRPDWWLDRRARLGYVRIGNLANDTVNGFEAALRELRRGRVRGLVLDLRDCAGGLMGAALGAADLLIDEGRMLNILERGTLVKYDARPGRIAQPTVVVLVNGGTVSSGEILAGALKDRGVATLVGERTFGKGRVQTVLPLPPGQGAVMVSTGTFQRPNGQTIDRHDAKDAGSAGIAPDVEARMTEAAHAAWLGHAEHVGSNLVLTPEEMQAAPPDPVLERARALLPAR